MGKPISDSFRCKCDGTFYFNSHCGCYICNQCGRHRTAENGLELACCYCGYREKSGDPKSPKILCNFCPSMTICNISCFPFHTLIALQTLGELGVLAVCS